MNEENKYQICNLQLDYNSSKVLKIKIPKKRLISEPNTGKVIATLLDEENNKNTVYHLLKKQPQQHSDNEQYIELPFNFERKCSSEIDLPKKTKNDIYLQDEPYFWFYGNNYVPYNSNITANDLIKAQNDQMDEYINSMLKSGGFIKDGVEHCTINLCNHGAENQMYYFQQDGGKTSFIRCALYVPFQDRNFINLKSFYLSNHSCYGAYYDKNGNTLFEELQKKIKNMTNPPKCFIRCIKSEYPETNIEVYDKDWNIVGLKSLPSIDALNLEDLEQNKDNYFDYYYITKDSIYKVPHQLVKDRVELIENNKFDEKFAEYCKEGKIVCLKHKQLKRNIKNIKKIEANSILPHLFQKKQDKAIDNKEIGSNEKKDTVCCNCSIF